MSIRKYHLPPLQDGFQIYHERLEIAGIHHYKEGALNFIKKDNQWLEFEREYNNVYDDNAIRILGCWKGIFGIKKVTLGYVPRDIARHIAQTKSFDKVKPRLLKTYLGSSGYVEVLFQIIGPKEHALEYKQAAIDPNGHYTAQVNLIKYYKQQKMYDKAIHLLMYCVEETEKEARIKNWGVAPWYYEQLAIIYHKLKRYDEEIQILQRYAQQPKAPGVGPSKLEARLEKALLRRSQQSLR